MTYKCLICIPEREFESEIAFNTHNEFHKETEEKVLDELEQKDINNNFVEAINKLENNKNMEANNMELFKKKVEEKTPIPTLSIYNNYLYILQLEVSDKDNKKAIKVFEEVNKTIMELMAEGYDVVLKHQKTEKQ